MATNSEHYLDVAHQLRAAVDLGSNATHLAGQLTMSASQVRHYVRLDKNLSAATKALCRKTDQLTMGHARVLATLPKDKQMAVARNVLAKGWSVRYLERYVRAPSPPEDRVYYEQLSETLSEQLGHPLSIRPDSNVPQNGEITLRYFGFDDFDAICSKMGIVVEP